MNVISKKDQHDEILIAYGYGDGGGGPTKEMLEVQKRLQKTLPDMPTITGNHVGAFLIDWQILLRKKLARSGTANCTLNTIVEH